MSLRLRAKESKWGLPEGVILAHIAGEPYLINCTETETEQKKGNYVPGLELGLRLCPRKALHILLQFCHIAALYPS